MILEIGHVFKINFICRVSHVERNLGMILEIGLCVESLLYLHSITFEGNWV